VLDARPVTAPTPSKVMTPVATVGLNPSMPLKPKAKVPARSAASSFPARRFVNRPEKVPWVLASCSSRAFRAALLKWTASEKRHGASGKKPRAKKPVPSGLML
jgi:hypothetical protein